MSRAAGRTGAEGPTNDERQEGVHDNDEQCPVLIAGWIDYEPGERQQVLEQFGEVARISREEPGCLDYAVTLDLDDERRIRVFEHWESNAALGQHLTRPHVLEFRTATTAFHRLGRSLSRHLVASSEPMQSSSST